jgi:hypothetical protein
VFRKREPNEIVEWRVNPETGKKYPVDKDGKTVPERYLFGFIPDYGNPFKPDGTKLGALKPYLYAATLVIPMAIMAALRD